MADLPEWLSKGMRDEGWVVFQSLDAFDVYGGDRFPSRDDALEEALHGDAALASEGEISLTREIEGEFFIGRLWRSDKPLESQRGAMLVYSVDSVERHVKLTRGASPPEGSAPVATRPESEKETRPWTCPGCKTTWNILEEEPEIPQDKAHCPKCGKPPTGFTPGQVVRVREGKRTRLGVIDDPCQAAIPVPGDKYLVEDTGPYTGEFMVWHLTRERGTAPPDAAEVEREVFGCLPTEPERRLKLAVHIMTGTSAAPDQIEGLTPEEERELFGKSDGKR